MAIRSQCGRLKINTKEYSELYKDKKLVIPAHGFIIMRRRDAVAFLAQPTKYDREYGRGAKPLSKKLHVENTEASKKPIIVEEEETESICNVCGLAFITQQQLTDHINDSHKGLPEALNEGD